MASASNDPVRHTLDGTIVVFLSEALLFPTGLVTAAFMTRRLGPDNYGLLVVATSLVTWVEWTIASLFSGATVKFVSEADDWRPVGATVTRLYLVASVGAALLVYLLAVPLARLMDAPELAGYLRLFALDIPIFCLYRAQTSLLVGLGGFRQRAVASAGRWMARMVLIVALLELGFSVPGAILGNIGASLVALLIGYVYVRPPLFYRPGHSMWRLAGYALPLFLYNMSMRLFDKVDLWALKSLGGTAAQAGMYGAAQNLALIPGVVALSFSPLLLSTLSRTLHSGDEGLARAMGRGAMRAVLLLLPLAASMAGAAPEIVVMVFGSDFLPAAPLLAVLAFAGMGTLMISVTCAILVAAGRPGWTFGLGGPLILATTFAHLLVIPVLGPIGAGLVSATFAVLGALVGILLVYRVWNVLPPPGTLLRSTLASALAFAVTTTWDTSGLLLLLKLAAALLAALLAFVLMGEISKDEFALARSLLRWPSAGNRDGPEI